jgi:general secretion pathway protein A
LYKDYFGLKDLPFSIAPDPSFLYMSIKHREALAHLVYGINSEGAFVLLTGEVGTGKTTICRCMLDRLPENCDTAFIMNPRLTDVELLATICDEIGIAYPEGTSSVKTLVDLINRCLLDSHAAGRKTLLIIDEAQNLSSEVLEQLRLLTNLETNRFKLLQIVLIGQPELRDLLAKPELRQLSQRITARFHLEPLSSREVADYIEHRLMIAGAHRRLFPAKAAGRLFRLSKGIPRLINLICDRALLGVYVQGKDSVDLVTLKKAAGEVLGAARPAGLHKKFMHWLRGRRLSGAANRGD